MVVARGRSADRRGGGLEWLMAMEDERTHNGWVGGQVDSEWVDEWWTVEGKCRMGEGVSGQGLGRVWKVGWGDKRTVDAYVSGGGWVSRWAEGQVSRWTVDKLTVDARWWADAAGEVAAGKWELDRRRRRGRRGRQGQERGQLPTRDGHGPPSARTPHGSPETLWPRQRPAPPTSWE